MTTPCNPCQITDSGCVPECKESVREPTLREFFAMWGEVAAICNGPYDSCQPCMSKYGDECIIGRIQNYVTHRNIDQAIKLYKELKGEDNKPEPEECKHEWKVESGFCQFVNVKCTKCGAEDTVEG